MRHSIGQWLLGAVLVAGAGCGDAVQMSTVRISFNGLAMTAAHNYGANLVSLWVYFRRNVGQTTTDAGISLNEPTPESREEYRRVAYWVPPDGGSSEPFEFLVQVPTEPYVSVRIEARVRSPCNGPTPMLPEVAEGTFVPTTPTFTPPSGGVVTQINVRVTGSMELRCR